MTERHPDQDGIFALYTSLTKAFWALSCVKRHPRRPQEAAEGDQESEYVIQYKNLVHVRAVALVYGGAGLTMGLLRLFWEQSGAANPPYNLWSFQASSGASRGA